MNKLWLAILAALLLPQDQSERIGKKVRELLDSEFGKLNRDIEDILKKELPAKTGQDTEVKPAVKGGAIDDVLPKLTKDTIREIVSTIASDEYEGRCAGCKGNDMTADYFAKIYAKAGLKPVGDKDDSGNPTYLQHFKIQGRATQNTVAFLEGSDPKLKNEIVVIGGHHDHLGKGNQGPAMQKLGRPTADDDVYNGADDNGSGSSTIVAMAKAFGESGIKPRRSILFMTFSGEEWGLLGSAHYVNNPIFPLEGTVAMINIDMIGRNPNKPVDCRGVGTEDGDMFEKIVEKACKKTGLECKQFQEHTVMGGDSDHSNFIRHKVPSMFFFAGMHPDYHRVTDHVDKLSFDHMELIGRTIMLVLWELANQDGKAVFSKNIGGGHGFEWPGDVKPPKPGDRKLGFLPSLKFSDEEMEKAGLEKDAGGILVESVSDDSVASKAGLKKGDVIVSIDGKKLSRPTSKSLAELKDAIKAVKPKTPVSIGVLRDQKPVELKAEWND